MLTRLPKLNTKCASDIHQELEAIASVYLPEWRGHEVEGEFGQALLKIIARLGEHVSSRVGKTPWRDTIAFFDSLDIPVQAPQPSSAPLVFQLAEKLEAPVFAPAGIQVGASGEEGELLFESLEAINLTPARLEFIAAVDAENDSIEIAPPGFLELEPPVEPLPRFFASSFAEKGSTTLQITPFEDLEEGNQIQINEAVYRLGKGQDGLFNLLDPLEEDVQEEDEIHKVVNFEAFNNRDLQEHALYIGHSELLNLEQSTDINLHFSPSSVASLLNADNGEWQLFASEKDTEPRWYSLTRKPDSLAITFTKDKGIKTEKTEINGIENFWFRFVFTGIEGGEQLQQVRLSSIEIDVKTNPIEEQDSNGGSNAANGSPIKGSSGSHLM